MQFVPSGIAQGGCLLAVSSVLTRSGDLGWRARPCGHEARALGLLGALGFECGCIHMLRCRVRHSPCDRSEIPGVRNEKVPACSPEMHF